MIYGKIMESDLTAGQFRVQAFIQNADRIDFGNCGVPTQLKDFISNNKSLIEDIFVDNDGLYILPATAASAGKLFNLCTGKKNEWNDYDETLADEINWTKIENRYWLSLWWD